MGFLELAMLAARSLAVVINNPLLGGGSSQNFQETSGLLTIFADILAEGDEAIEELRAFTSVVRAMADEGRGPTREERGFLNDRRNITHEGYQAEKTRILSEIETAADEEAEATRQAIAEEVAALEAIAEEDRTAEQVLRLEELTSEE